MTLRRLSDFDKNIHRHQAKTLRREAYRARSNAGAHAAAHFMRTIVPPPKTVIAVYYPIGTELDSWPLVDALLNQLHAVCLPVVIAKNQPLIFRRFNHDTALSKGPLGIDTPTAEAETLVPDIVLVPLLAFTRQGTRLGMGGGYYDRTLEKLRAQGPIKAVGYAYGLQEMPHLRAAAHDQPLDWIITEREAIKAQT